MSYFNDVAVISKRLSHRFQSGVNQMRMTRLQMRSLCWLVIVLAISTKADGSSDIRGLNASGPAPSIAEKLMLYGQFIGDWEFDYIGTNPDKSKVTGKGEWNFRWVLQGRAIQDTWILPLRSQRRKTGEPADEYGTTLRIYDSRIDAWRIVWSGPVNGTLRDFIARKVDDTIVQECETKDGTPMRWIISEITDKSFHWRSVISKDKGISWQPREELFARRVGGAGREEENTSTSKIPSTQTQPEVPGLAASGPDAAFAPKLMLFGQFVGEWKFDYVKFKTDGTKELGKGEWNFGWILEGRAVQDVWMIPGTNKRNKARLNTMEFGTTLRFYDSKIDAWHIAWVGPVSGNLLTFIARRVGDEIILEGKDYSGAPIRWIFSKITQQSFHCRGETFAENGKTWRLQLEMSVRRVSAPKRALLESIPSPSLFLRRRD